MEKQQAQELIDDIWQQLSVSFPFLKGWRTGLDYAKRRAGICKISTKEINISLWHIEHNELEVVKDTILHEFAHAIAYEKYGAMNHGSQWQQVAVEIGATPKATGNFKLPKPNWLLVICSHQQKKIEVIGTRYRRNTRIRSFAIRGQAKTKGSLYYLSQFEFSQFELGRLTFDELKLLQ